MMDVVRSVVVVVVVVPPDVTPGHCIWPADPESDINKVSITTAQFWRKVFTRCLLESTHRVMQNFCMAK
jgi:hypothetical protein